VHGAGDHGHPVRRALRRGRGQAPRPWSRSSAPALHKRRDRLADTIEALIAEFASHSPGWEDDLLLVDSTPVECARSVDMTRRSALADAADYGYCTSHSRFFWGFRLHACSRPTAPPARFN
jgi:hypothetical protein